MTIDIQKSENQILAILDGELDTAAAADAEVSLQPLLESEGKDVVIDCTRLEYIASSGLRLLLGILKKAKSVGSRVVLKNVNDVVKDVLELTGFISIFEFE
jgi:anti-sigma B factor antagonist